MSAPAQRFVSAEMLGMAILAGVPRPAGGVVNVVQSTSMALSPGTVRLRRVPSEAGSRFEDHAHLEYMVFEADFLAAQTVADRCRQALEFSRAQGFALDDGTWITVDHSEAVLPPAEVPWPNPDVRVFQGTHLIVTRAASA